MVELKAGRGLHHESSRGRGERKGHLEGGRCTSRGQRLERAVPVLYISYILRQTLPSGECSVVSSLLKATPNVVCRTGLTPLAPRASSPDLFLSPHRLECTHIFLFQDLCTLSPWLCFSSR